jgi:hypothetical protein
LNGLIFALIAYPFCFGVDVDTLFWAIEELNKDSRRRQVNKKRMVVSLGKIINKAGMDNKRVTNRMLKA